jgi:uncharacterized protein (TIGR02996 family)
MSDEEALLAAILAHPDEDTPRLMYADWLDEHGQPERAEFIRIQCAPEPNANDQGRMFELEEWYRSKWVAGLPQGTSLEWEFRRGFPEWVNGYGWLFLQHYEAIAGVVWVRSLTITGMTGSQTQDFVSRTWNPQWIELELQAQVLSRRFQSVDESTATIVAVANCPQIARLRLLRFSLFRLSATAVRTLVSSPHLDNLQQLRLDCIFEDRADAASLRARFGNRFVYGGPSPGPT